ncbi:putative ubiquitin conjugation factor E4 [Smittium culicis]|uniref:Putative ubiquitin conjugation factor E4 n=1 Tax=Smittium culicis TaxID=133412 RepID=A0A1R1XQX5_9FUNG|nr:putative ubiquitin conjugation factor E4 [Smittium culicis]
MSTKTIQQWEDGAFSRILGATVNASDSKAKNLYFLSSLAADLESSNSPLLLTSMSLEMALIELLDSDQFLSKTHSFTFLFKAWEKASEIHSNIKGPKGSSLDQETKLFRLNSLDSIINILLSYAGLSLQDDSLFSTNSSNVFIDIFISNPSNYTLYFNLLISRFYEDGLTEIMSNMIKNINYRILANSNIIDGKVWIYLKASEFLFGFAKISETISKIDWFMNGSEREIQTSSVLGPMFSISAFPDEDDGAVMKYFEGLDSSSRSNQLASISSIQSSVSTLQAYQFRIINSFVRSSKDSRAVFISWAAKAIFSNLKRTGSQADPKLYVSSGFADNLANVFIELSKPFAFEPQLSKLSKVNISTWGPIRASSGQLDSYGQNQDIVKKSWNELTRLCSNSEDSLKWDSKLLETPGLVSEIGFIPDCFFIATLAINFGPLSSIFRIMQLGKQIQQLSQSLNSIESNQQNGSTSTSASNPLLAKWKAHLSSLKCKRLALEAHCLDPRRLMGLLNFSRFTMASILELHQLALSNDVNYWNCFPEYILEDTLALLLFVTRYSPDTLMNQELSPPQPGLRLLEDLFISLFVACLSKPELIRNPHLKSKLVDVLHSLTYFPPEDDDDYVDTNVSSDSSINPFDRSRKRKRLSNFAIVGLVEIRKKELPTKQANSSFASVDSGAGEQRAGSELVHNTCARNRAHAIVFDAACAETVQVRVDNSATCSDAELQSRFACGQQV